MKKKNSLEENFAARLVKDEALREKFREALQGKGSFSSSIVCFTEALPFETEESFSFQPSFTKRVSSTLEPGKYKEHEAGDYYILDPSSIFAASPLYFSVAKQIENPKLVLDMCAAPGGKAIFAWRCLTPELLICNEVVSKRIGALHSNLTRCKIHPSKITSSDPKWIGESAERAAQVVIVDAPCSGQSLPVKGKSQPGCFHKQTINMNANRQKRILAESSKCVAPNGFLLYSTCTFSREENEKVVSWFLKKFPDFSLVEVPELAGYRTEFIDEPCYRLWPMTGEGAGAFCALLKYEQYGEAREPDFEGLRVRWSSEEV